MSAATPEPNTDPSWLVRPLAGQALVWSHQDALCASQEGDDVEIEVVDGPFNASFHGKFLSDGTYTGGWRPNPGADPNINVAYDIASHKLD